MRARNGEVELAYRTQGAGDPLLLINGSGGTMEFWPAGLLDEFTARGFEVARYDHRDTGQSAHLPAADYGMTEMVDDAVAVLDALGWESTHIVGISLGGAIAQLLAVAHPTRVRTLTSIMSFSSYAIGERSLPDGILTEDPVESLRASLRVMGSPAFPADEDWIAKIIALRTEHGWDLEGLQRHGKAMVEAGDFRESLREIDVPTLVMHGTEDRARGIEGGVETAKAIPGAKFVAYSGWGHDLPRALWPSIVIEIRVLADLRK